MWLGGDERADGDIDLLADAPSGIGLLALARFQRDVEELLYAPVEVIVAHELRPAVTEEIAADVVSL